MKSRTTTTISSSPTNQTPKRIAALVGACHLVVAVVHGGPVAVPDVPAYLSVAQWVHGGTLPPDLAFHPGYGFLLSPFGFLSGSNLHLIALVANSILAVCAVLLSATLCRRLGGSERLVTMVALVAAFHPSLTAASRIGWPETALVVFVLGTALYVDTQRWIAAGIVAGVAVSFHPRAIVLLIAVFWVAFSETRILIALKGALIGLLPTGLMMWVTHTWPSARLEAAQHLGEGPNPVATIAGQWLVLGAGTGGLAVVALVAAVPSLRTRSTSASVRFVVLSAIGMLVLGGWVLAGSDRADTLFYSRYIGPWAVPLTILGLVAVERRVLSRRLTAIVVAVTAATLGLLLSQTGSVTESSRRIMTLDLGAIWAMLGERLVLVGLAAFLIVAVTAVASRRGVFVPLAVLFLVAVPSTVVNHRHLHSVGRIAEGQAATAQLIPEATNCLSHDQSAKSYALWLYRLELPRVLHRRVDLSKGQAPCDQYVIADVGLTTDCAAVKLLAKEPRANWGLWLYPTKGCD